MNFLKTILIALVAFFLTTCKKEVGEKSVNAKLTFVGVASCGWLIKLDVKDKDGNDMLEPTNLSSFSVTLSEGQAVEMTYTEKNSPTSCMVGKVVDLKSIKDR